MHTKDKLADELAKIGLTEMSRKAREGQYQTFLSTLDEPEIPEQQLLDDLAAIGTPEAMALRERALNDEFEWTSDEEDDYINSEKGRADYIADFGAPPKERPKFKIDQMVYKCTGDYTGPGRVRGFVHLPNGRLRYAVAHCLERGTGEFLQLYERTELRAATPEEDDDDFLDVPEAIELRKR